MRLTRVTLTLLLATPVWAQSASFEETAVRTLYAQLSFLSESGTVTKFAMGRPGFDPSVAPEVFNRRVEEAAPHFTISDVKVGPLSDILNVRWGDLLSGAPQAPAEQLYVQFSTQNFKDGDLPEISWGVASAEWKPGDNDDPVILAQAMDRTFADMMKLDHGRAFDASIAWNRYATFHVVASFQGKTTSYKALYVFGKDAAGVVKASPQDLVTHYNIGFMGANTSPFPTGLLKTHLRLQPQIQAWLNQHAMAIQACSTTQHELCCSEGRCGISAGELSNELARPLDAKESGK